jgi:PAS domain S-box-containing protein
LIAGLPARYFAMILDRYWTIQAPAATHQKAHGLETPLLELDAYFPFDPITWSDDGTAGQENPASIAHRSAQRESGRRFRALLDALPAAVYTTDTAGRITFYNEAAAELWGCRPELGKSEWCGSWQLRFPDGRPMRHDECPMAIALREVRTLTGEAIAVRPDGTQVPFAAYPKPLFDQAGRLIGAVNTLVDITHRKAHEERQSLLINELNHRVKNTLATVQSIAQQSLRGCPQGEVRWFQGRLVALSHAHDLLTEENWRGVGMRPLLMRVVAPLVAPPHPRFQASGPDLFLPPRLALSLSLALHELCTNAAKYGALSVPQGLVRVFWSLAGDNGTSRLRLRWEEANGPPVKPPRKRGFGTRLITRGVAHELSAEVRLEYPATGVTCEIDTPLQ